MAGVGLDDEILALTRHFLHCGCSRKSPEEAGHPVYCCKQCFQPQTAGNMQARDRFSGRIHDGPVHGPTEVIRARRTGGTPFQEVEPLRKKVICLERLEKAGVF